jgi:hypothetical protein
MTNQSDTTAAARAVVGAFHAAGGNCRLSKDDKPTRRPCLRDRGTGCRARDCHTCPSVSPCRICARTGCACRQAPYTERP